MAELVDAKGRTWEITLDVATVKRVKQLTGCNLGVILRDEFEALAELVGDPISLIDVTYAICQPQAEKLGVTDEQFGQSFSGDSVESAYRCLLEALIDFFPNRQGKILKKLTTTIDQAAATLATKAEAETEKLTPEMVCDFVSSSQASAE